MKDIHELENAQLEAVQEQMKAKDEIRSAMNRFFDASRKRTETEVNLRVAEEMHQRLQEK